MIWTNNDLSDKINQTNTNLSTVNNSLAGKAPSNHTHAWSTITSRPSTFTPSTHNHDSLYKTVSDGSVSLSGITSITSLCRYNNKIGMVSVVARANAAIANAEVIIGSVNPAPIVLAYGYAYFDGVGKGTYAYISNDGSIHIMSPGITSGSTIRFSVTYATKWLFR